MANNSEPTPKTSDVQRAVSAYYAYLDELVDYTKEIQKGSEKTKKILEQFKKNTQ